MVVLACDNDGYDPHGEIYIRDQNNNELNLTVGYTGNAAYMWRHWHPNVANSTVIGDCNGSCTPLALPTNYILPAQVNYGLFSGNAVGHESIFTYEEPYTLVK